MRANLSALARSFSLSILSFALPSNIKANDFSCTVVPGGWSELDAAITGRPPSRRRSPSRLLLFAGLNSSVPLYAYDVHAAVHTRRHDLGSMSNEGVCL